MDDETLATAFGLWADARNLEALQEPDRTETRQSLEDVLRRLVPDTENFGVHGSGSETALYVFTGPALFVVTQASEGQASLRIRCARIPLSQVTSVAIERATRRHQNGWMQNVSQWTFNMADRSSVVFSTTWPAQDPPGSLERAARAAAESLGWRVD